MTDEPVQLTFAIDDPDAPADEPRPLPQGGTVAISGRLVVKRDLYRRQKVRVVVTDEDGELLATGIAGVVRISFEEHEERNGVIWTERAHRVRLD